MKNDRIKCPEESPRKMSRGKSTKNAWDMNRNQTKKRYRCGFFLSNIFKGEFVFNHLTQISDKNMILY